MCIPENPNSQTSKPPRPMMIALTAMKRLSPSTMTNVPRIKKAIRLALRCAKDPCKKGEVMMPTSPCSVLGTRPKAVRL
ncbi:hypothetical protein D3C84_1229820 [compost metagenome]